MNELALFAGAGGGILGSVLLGHRVVCAVEAEPYRREVLLRRQRDGVLPLFPIWDDVRTFDGRPWRGAVDLVSGGFPCQDISAAGKGAGVAAGEHSGLWREFARVVREVGPRFVFVENSPNLTSRGLDIVLGDLAALGFDAEWDVFGARHVGAPHRRDRIWILAHAHRDTWNEWREGDSEQGEGGRDTDQSDERQDGIPDAYGLRELQPEGIESNERGRACDRGWWDDDPADVEHTDETGQEACWPERGDGVPAGEPQDDGPATSGAGDRAVRNRWGLESDLGRVANGVAHRVDRLAAIGDGQVPLVAAVAFQELMRRAIESLRREPGEGAKS